VCAACSRSSALLPTVIACTAANKSTIAAVKTSQGLCPGILYGSGNHMTVSDILVALVLVSVAKYASSSSVAEQVLMDQIHIAYQIWRLGL
jgi:hypothetical protein